MNRGNTAASLEQRRANLRAINARRSAAPTCCRGHSNWRVLKDGRRQCRTCSNERNRYYRMGMLPPP